MYHFHHLYRDKNFYYLPSLYYKRLTSKKEKVFYRDYLQTINKIQNEFNLNAFYLIREDRRHSLKDYYYISPEK